MSKLLVAVCTGIGLFFAVQGSAGAASLNSHLSGSQIEAFCGSIDTDTGLAKLTLNDGTVLTGSVDCSATAESIAAGDSVETSIESDDQNIDDANTSDDPQFDEGDQTTGDGDNSQGVDNGDAGPSADNGDDQQSGDTGEDGQGGEGSDS